VHAIFADTSFWIAMLNPKDGLHAKAKSVAATLGATPLVTSQMVFAELLNDFAHRGPTLRDAARQLVETLSRNPSTTVVPQSAVQFHTALSLYGERSDKAWAFTDCASFLIMHTFGIGDALTYDKHFEQMGFRALLRK
jgi:predicted nucleic acid-binding protein